MRREVRIHLCTWDQSRIMSREANSIPIIMVLCDLWEKLPEVSSCWAENNFLANTELSLDICKVERDYVDSQKDSRKSAQTVGD